MFRVEIFNKVCKAIAKDQIPSNSDLRTFYLGQIAYHLAIIADCLEDRKERKKDECSS